MHLIIVRTVRIEDIPRIFHIEVEFPEYILSLMTILYKLLINYSMGDLQDPIDGGTLVPFVGPYFVGIFPEI